MHDLCDRARIFYQREHADRGGQVEAPRTAGAGIEVKHSLVPSDIWLMRVSIENGGELRRRWIEMNALHIVQHVKVVSLEENDFSLRQLAASTLSVDVAANSGYRRDRFQRIENLEITYISEMQDVLGPGESRQDLGTQKAVRIADNANLHLPKLKRADQRPFTFRRSGLATGSIICSTEPGFWGSFIAMQ